MNRLFDIILSLLGLIILSPFFIYIAVRIKQHNKGNVFYKQKRIGKGGSEFFLYKFRTMRAYSDTVNLLTYGDKDERITKFGSFLRKYKLDEMPQLLNVLMGDMSIVGPRPEVKKYVDYYTTEQRKVLDVKPGITDVASIHFYNESELLAAQQDPERYYIEQIMPAKIELNRKFISDPSIGNYLRIIGLTIKKIATH